MEWIVKVHVTPSNFSYYDAIGDSSESELPESETSLGPGTGWMITPCTLNSLQNTPSKTSSFSHFTPP